MGKRAEKFLHDLREKGFKDWGWVYEWRLPGFLEPQMVRDLDPTGWEEFTDEDTKIYYSPKLKIFFKKVWKDREE